MTREVMFRLPPELVARADARARQMTQETGLRATRTDVARLALVAYLGEQEAAKTCTPRCSSSRAAP